MSSKRFGIYFLLALLLVGCGYDNHEECPTHFESVQPTLHARQLTLYAADGAVIPEGGIIEGVVVANDASGNFYRAIVLEMEDMGVEVRLALYDLHALYPVGATVVVHCGGLRATYMDGVLTLGRTMYGWSGGSVEPIAPRSEVLSRVEVVSMGTPREALQCGIEELGEELCGRLVEIGGLHYEGEATEWAVANYGGDVEHTFEDAEENKIVVRISTYADFASEKIPEGELTVRGILYKVGDVYLIKPRVRSDVARSI